MAFAPSDPAASDMALTAHKILIAGGFGAGKTTLVSAISEVRPLLTEEPLSASSVGRDNLVGLPNKTTTTVALDFGRITIASLPSTTSKRAGCRSSSPSTASTTRPATTSPRSASRSTSTRTCP
jgi:hypothetical protein